ncbi:MAG TPA: GYD domain-containing protein [Thermodesulfovibrionales bacterium]|nr:GYD domain-containing protein [Thermodesulfovibrionales bacterium]
MNYYMLQASYTAEAVKDLIKNPQNRREVVEKAIQKLGGRLEGFWFSFGQYDVVVICQMPDSVRAAALALAVLGGGALRAGITTPLMTAEEALEAMKKAGETGYKPPRD